MRRELGEDLRFVGEDDQVLAYRLAGPGGAHLVAVNLGDDSAVAPAAGEVVLRTTSTGTSAAPTVLAPGEGFLATIDAASGLVPEAG